MSWHVSILLVFFGVASFLVLGYGLYALTWMSDDDFLRFCGMEQGENGEWRWPECQ